tara:strand:+ start:210 stop:794 length:585 start_codon:yes stop_codon:yes gene_type:complete
VVVLSCGIHDIQTLLRLEDHHEPVDVCFLTFTANNEIVCSQNTRFQSWSKCLASAATEPDRSCGFSLANQEPHDTWFDTESCLNIPQNQNKAVFVVNSLEETSDVKVRLLCWLTQYEHGFQKNQFCVILSISKASLTKMVLCESHFGHKAQVGKNFGQKSKLKIYFEQPREHLLLPLCHPTPHTRLHHSVVRRF